jgi:hypothetical protein
MRSRRLRIAALAIAVSLPPLAACQKQPAERADRAFVSGAISYQGKPLRAGLVTFSLAEDPSVSASCILQPEGTYSVQDAPIGPTHVAVDTKAILGGAADRYVELPAKYAVGETSGLTFTVKPGRNESVDFNLE